MLESTYRHQASRGGRPDRAPLSRIARLGSESGSDTSWIRAVATVRSARSSGAGQFRADAHRSTAEVFAVGGAQLALSVAVDALHGEDADAAAALLAWRVPTRTLGSQSCPNMQPILASRITRACAIPGEAHS